MKNKTILICDDDEGIIKILCLILKNFGFSIISEKNSLNIFSMIERSQPDLLLLDLWMPALNGDEIIRNLKSKPATRNIPIILISASPGANSLAAETGADGFLAKPFQLNELIGLIENKLYIN